MKLTNETDDNYLDSPESDRMHCTTCRLIGIVCLAAISLAIVFGVLGMGCRSKLPPGNTSTAPTLYGETNAAVLDRASIQPAGKRLIDLNNDGIDDLVWIDDGHTVWWSKSSKGPDQALGVFIQPMFAYTFLKVGDQWKLIFWTEDGQGYETPCLGLDKDGLPYFGPVEDRK